MARKKVSARAAVIDVLEKEGRPMHVKDIAARVLADYATGLKGKTPEASIAALLHTGSTRGVDFRKTKPGTFTLRANAKTSARAAAGPPPPKNMRRRRTQRQSIRRARVAA